MGKLILLRCGESTFNANRTFTGWLDPDLTVKGILQCQTAAQVLLAAGFDPDVVYTSRLKRAIKSLWVVLETMDNLYIPAHKTVRLNQRHYGALQGLSKVETAKQFGTAAVHAWRYGLKAKPPPLAEDDVSHPKHDRRYADLADQTLLPSTESLRDCQERARPLWDHRLVKDIRKGKTVLVVAHRDSLRGLAQVIDGLDEEEAMKLHLPKGVPCVYRFEEEPSSGKLKPLSTPDGKDDKDSPTSTAKHSAKFLNVPASLTNAAVEEGMEKDPHLPLMDDDDDNVQNGGLVHGKRRDKTLLETLKALRLDQQQTSTHQAHTVKHHHTRWTDDPSEFEEYEYDEFSDFDNVDDDINIVQLPLPAEPETKVEEPVVVLVRHGRTPHNNLGLFTGWEDPPLAEEGVEDARRAGRLLKRHNFEFDVCYTSWLTRAIQTAYYCLDELDTVWLPVIKSWRLNERMYGSLTGKSKAKLANDYGAEQLQQWRRGYTIRPPPVSSYSPQYPGNDVRRTKHFEDLGVSWRESVSRSWEQRKWVLHRQFPKTESLKDCMDRSIPYYTNCIRKEAVQKGKRVLIASHENALRGILMHLCDIPEEAMNQLHLPNGLPLVYSVTGKCITLLDDGSGRDPMEVHDFGPAAKYLFKPCELGDDFFE